MINDHLEVISFLYLLFSVIGIITVIREIHKSHKISIMSMCNIMYIAVLCIIPALILYGYSSESNAKDFIKYEQEYLWTFYVQLIITVIGYVFFNLGYCIKQRDREKKETQKKDNTILISVLFSVISLISLLLWASGYGGITGLLDNANFIRAGWIKSSNSFTFFKHFVPLALLASWMLFNAIIKRKIDKFVRKVIVLLLLVLNIAISSIYIQANDGRLLLAIYILLFFVIYLKYIYETKSVKIMLLLFRFAIVLLVFVVILFNADSILRDLRGETPIEEKNATVLENISDEFSFIILGTQTALEHNYSDNAELMIDNDVINGVFAWLPYSMKPIILEDVWDHNTRLINTKSYGQSPTSIVAQSVYDLGLVGIIIIPFLYGMFIKKTEKLLEAYKNNVFYETIYVALGFYLSKGIPYFSLYNIMINTFFIFVAIFIYKFVQKVKF